MAALTQPVTAVQSPAYGVRSFDPERDSDDIIRLCRSASLKCSPEKYIWKYRSAPCSGTWCALATDSFSKRPIGTTALFPRRLLVAGTLLKAGIAGDFAVEFGHRSLYSALALQRAAIQACLSGKFDVLYGFPNDAARLVQLRAGYVSLGQVLAGIRFLQTRRTLAKQVSNRFLGFASDIFDEVIRIVSTESRIHQSEYSYISLPIVDDRFDRFWEKTLPEHAVIVERNSAYANWRFLDCPDKKYSLFAAVHRGNGDIGGYVVWTRSQDGKVRISDLMADDNVIDGLLASFINLQRELGAHCITIVYFGNYHLIRRLRKFGFFFRKTSSQVLLCVNPRVNELERLFDSANWYLFDGDSDS